MPQRRVEAGHFSEDQEEFVRLLHRHGVRYLIVGGEAVIFHGYPRFTGDIDFFYEAIPENTRRLFRALEEFWGGDVPALQSHADLLETGIIVQYGRPPNRIDLLSTVDGISFEEAWRERVQAALGDEPDVLLNFVGLRHLIASKEAAARPRDLEDLRYLRRVGGG